MIIENGNYYVYIHTSPSGKMYVGQTGQKAEKRWGSGGIGYLDKKNGKYTQPLFAHAILKYGWDNFSHEIVASNLTKEEADNFEKLLIEKLNTMNPQYGYNLKEGGSNGRYSEESKKRISESQKGKIVSEETKKKLSESHKGFVVAEETKKKISESLKGENCYMYGKHLSEETKKKISESSKGKKHPESTKNKISESLKGENHPMYGKKHTEETLEKMSKSHRTKAKKVAQYDLQENLIKIWECVTDIANEFGVSKCAIRNCYRGRSQTSCGFIWKEHEDIKVII